MGKKVEKVKKNVDNNKKVYITAGVIAVVAAGITVLIMRGVASQPIDRGIAVVAKRGIAVQGKKVVMNNVSYISADRQGPPSWVIRCKETGEIFTSQRSAASLMNIPENELSRHLNGLRDHVRGNTFERICMAA